MKSTRASLLLASALAAIAGSNVVVADAADPSMQVRADTGTQSARKDIGNPSRLGERNAIAKAMFGGYGSWNPKRHKRGPGWTHAHVQRMARKRRNQKRNKLAHR